MSLTLRIVFSIPQIPYRVENLEGNYLSKKDSAASAKKLDTDAGADNQPVYFENGIPVTIGHTIDSDVPKNAKFTDTTYTDATATQHGLMSVDDKKKLNGIAENANNYTHPTSSGNRHIPSGGSAGQFLKWSADGTAVWANDNNTTYVPATTSQNGLMSADDKKKLDNMPTELNKKLNTSQKGVAGGLAELDQTGRVPANQLPSFVDDVVEGYYYDSKFYKESTHGTVIDGEAGKIYVDLSNNKTYRWGGTAFTVISETLAIGNTATTAGRGDWTKTAYDHSQLAHAPANAQANQNAFSKVTVGDTTINSGNATDTLTLTAGTNVTLTPDASGKKVTIASKDTTYGVVSSTSNGLAPKSDGSTNKYLRADGSWQIPPNTDTKYNNFTGASANANGNAGLVPAPNMGDQNKYLKADGSWSTPTDTNTDTKVSQTVTTTTGNYPILLGSAGQTANATQGAYFGKGITANPNTSTITATTFSGKATSAGTADTAKAIAWANVSDKPSIPSVYNNKITITQGGSTKGSFTLNQNSDLTINLADNNTWTAFKGATSTSAGTAGYISTVPQQGQTGLYFKSDGTWGTPTNTTYNDVTITDHGLMTATDKVKLNGIQAKATAVSFSRSLSSGTKIGAITINGTSTDIYCQTNTDTHHAAYLYTGASSTATANAQASNGSLYLNLVENGTVRNSHKITGSGATSVTSDTSGNITISSTNTVYTHPTTAGNKHIPTGGSSGQLLGYSANGEAKWVEGFTAITDTELDSMITEVFG